MNSYRSSYGKTQQQQQSQVLQKDRLRKISFEATSQQLSTIEVPSQNVPLLKSHKVAGGTAQHRSLQHSPLTQRQPADGRTMLNWKKALSSLNAEQGMLLENIDSIVYKPRKKRVISDAHSQLQSQQQQQQQSQQQLYILDQPSARKPYNQHHKTHNYVSHSSNNYNYNHNDNIDELYNPNQSPSSLSSHSTLNPPFMNLLLSKQKRSNSNSTDSQLPSIGPVNLQVLEQFALVHSDRSQPPPAAAAAPGSNGEYQFVSSKESTIIMQNRRNFINQSVQQRSISMDARKEWVGGSGASSTIGVPDNLKQFLGFQRYNEQSTRLVSPVNSNKKIPSTQSEQDTSAVGGATSSNRCEENYPEISKSLVVVSNQSLQAAAAAAAAKKLNGRGSPRPSQSPDLQLTKKFSIGESAKGQSSSVALSPTKSQQSSAQVSLRTDIPSRKHALILPRVKVIVLDEVINADDIYRHDWIRQNLEKYWLQMLNDSVQRVTDFDLLQRVQPYAKEILGSSQYKSVENQWSGGKYVLGECSKWNLLKQIQMYEKGHLQQSKFYEFITHYFIPSTRRRQQVIEELVQNINKRLAKRAATASSPVMRVQVESIFDVNGQKINDLYDLDLTSTVLLAASSHVQMVPVGLKQKVSAMHLLEQKKYFANYQKAKLQSAYVIDEKDSPLREKKQQVNTMKLPQLLLRSE